MSELSRCNPTGRFTGLAECYARCRPTYPESAIDFIASRCGLRRGSVVVDVGCGTGISTRLFAQRGCRVIGVEPNDDMRHQAEAVVPGGSPAPLYRAGTAEATGLDPATADAVIAAQAFHWFDPTPTLGEFHRILKPGGWVALMWNERDESDPFTAAVGEVMRTWPKTASVEGPRAQAGDALLATPLFVLGERTTFRHGQELDEESLIGRVFSASYAPKERAAVERSASELRQGFARFQSGSRVVLRYQTTVFSAQAAPLDAAVD